MKWFDSQTLIPPHSVPSPRMSFCRSHSLAFSRPIPRAIWAHHKRTISAFQQCQRPCGLITLVCRLWHGITVTFTYIFQVHVMISLFGLHNILPKSRAGVSNQLAYIMDQFPPFSDHSPFSAPIDLALLHPTSTK